MERKVAVDFRITILKINVSLIHCLTQDIKKNSHWFVASMYGYQQLYHQKQT